MFPRLLLRAAQMICSSTPPGLHRWCARLVGAAQYCLSSRRREAVLENLAQIGRAGHPELAARSARERAARSMFESFHLAWIEYFAQGPARRQARAPGIRFQGADLLYRAVAGGRGAVIAAPHIGSWELAGVALARLGLPVHVVSGVQLHPFVAREVRKLKELDGLRVITPSEGFASLIATLRGGGIVVLLVDGDVFSSALPATFFGRRIPFPAGPAILARRANVAILHAHAARRPDGSHQIAFEGLDEPDRSLPLRADLQRLTALIARSQERQIAAHVTQWCIFRSLWGSVDAA